MTTSFSFASDSDSILYVSSLKQKVHNRSCSGHLSTIQEKNITHTSRFQKKDILQKNKLLIPFIKKKQPAGSGPSMIILSLLLLILGLLYLGVPGWAVILLVLGLILYIGFLAYLFYQLFHGEFKKPVFAWILLAIMIYLGLAGLLLLIGITPIGLVFAYALLYLTLGAIGIAAIMILAYALFKGMFALFGKLLHKEGPVQIENK